MAWYLECGVSQPGNLHPVHLHLVNWHKLFLPENTVTNVLDLVFLSLQRLVRYYSMKKDTIPIFGSCTFIELYPLDRKYLIRLVAIHHITEI